MDIVLTFAVDNDPTVILRVVLRDLLSRKLHSLLVIAIAVHCGEAFVYVQCA